MISDPLGDVGALPQNLGPNTNQARVRLRRQLGRRLNQRQSRRFYDMINRRRGYRQRQGWRPDAYGSELPGGAPLGPPGPPPGPNNMNDDLVTYAANHWAVIYGSRHGLFGRS